MAPTERGTPKRILLGVTGGIAAYKSPEIVRRLVERGCEVQVVMTQGARQFVTPLTFQAVSGRRVRDDLWDPGAEASMGHIELARWADVIVVAPATADFLAQLAAGLAGDLLATLCLATTAPIVVAPAMNHAMWSNPATQANRAVLDSRGVRFLGPAEGDQACGETGPGRMLEPNEIVSAVLELQGGLRLQPLTGAKVVITAGPTREAIDPVRYITNRSSGKMGFAVAVAARDAGADVVLVSGPVALSTPAGVRRVDVETAEQMYERVHAEIANAQVFIGCAAVSDYRPQKAARQKIKRSSPELELALVRSPDTLASVAALPKPPFTVGFAAETEDVARHAREKLEKKRVDMIAANQVGPDCGFDRETNALTVFWRGGELALGEATKPLLARRLLELIADRYRASRLDACPTSAAGRS
ncbi:MAG TPA: bifunctional phosphopantothenoylcysteine decarboxylase/phosphopantothenate--cysteine ligase CoaBC [Gammaproteobacteria bacterium]|nr:bifunctional phosphopantothenoylcysteine decarboxylase/phosphopantothenate--cysteine ligase CoaBC [Gammaproteobacteria bacterium]